MSSFNYLWIIYISIKKMKISLKPHKTKMLIILHKISQSKPCFTKQKLPPPS